MKKLPIIMEMSQVAVVHKNRKTQHRIEIKPCKDADINCELAPCEIAGEINNGNFRNSPWQIGDHLYIQQPWRFAGVSGWSMDASESCTGWIDYEFGADKEITAPNFDAVQALLPDDWDWDFPDIDYFPAESMPDWMAPIWLEITNIRIEKLQWISEADAIAEGAVALACDHARRTCNEVGCCGPTAYGDYQYLWVNIHGADSWSANPWVWVISFKVLEPIA